MNRKARFQAVLALTAILAPLAAVTPCRAGALYVYVAPDGSRLVTDHPRNDPGYRQIYRSGSTAHVGDVAAGRYAPAPVSYRSRAARSSIYDKLIRRVARSQRLDPALLKAVIHVESDFNPYAVSRKGASGLMQLMPATAQRYGVRNLFDPVENLHGGARYLSELLQTYNNNQRLALAAYNAGETAVERYRGIPPYSETRNYVHKVLVLTNRYTNKYYW
jgi:soluble lytic murein transglycosylase-like protein